MKKSFFIMSLLSLFLVGCGNESRTSESSKKDNDPNTKTVLFSGDAYKAKYTNGYKFTDSQNVNSLKTYCVEQVGSEELCSNIEVSDIVNNLDDLNKDGNRYLTLGSQSSVGSLTWHSVKSIKSVTAVVKNYDNSYNTNPQHSGRNVDRNSHFHIDDTDFSLEIGETEFPEFTSHTVSYGFDTYTFTISSSVSRVFVKELKITWNI